MGTRTNDRALSEFVKTVGEIDAVLQDLRNANDDHYDTAPEDVHWGHVGDVKATLADLRQILSRIRGEVA